MKINVPKATRKVLMVTLGLAFCYVGVVTALTGAVTVARQVHK